MYIFKNRELSINSIQQAIALEAKTGHCVEVLRHRATFFFGIKCLYGTFWSMLVLSHRNRSRAHVHIQTYSTVCAYIHAYEQPLGFVSFFACFRIHLFATPPTPKPGQCTFIRSSQGYGESRGALHVEVQGQTEG